MTKIRGFEVAKGFEEAGINLPARQTKNAAGYDFECAEDVKILSIWQIIPKLLVDYLTGDGIEANSVRSILKPTLVKTGVKAYMLEDEVLYLYNRSSNPLKKFLLLANGTGVIDSDYYENRDNDGHIMFQFINFGLLSVTLKKGERIGQGVFAQFLKADNDVEGGDRVGGLGSTNE